MKTRRGFLQTIGAALGSTVLPGSAVASVITADPRQMFSMAVAPGAAAVVAAEVVRRFKTATVLDRDTFEPKLQVTMSITQEVDGVIGDQTRNLEGDYKLEMSPDNLPGIDISSPEQMIISRNQLNLAVIQRSLKLEGLPSLTEQEIAMIMADEKPLYRTGHHEVI